MKKKLSLLIAAALLLALTAAACAEEPVYLRSAFQNNIYRRSLFTRESCPEICILPG